MIECQACHTQNPPGATYCSKCARKLDSSTQEAVVRRRAEHTATGIRWSTVIAAVVLILIVAVLATVVLTHVL